MQSHQKQTVVANVRAKNQACLYMERANLLLYWCTVVSITFFSALYIGHLVLFLLFLLALGTR